MSKTIAAFLMGLLLLCFVPATAAPSPTATDFVLDGAFKVSRPSADWAWAQEPNDTHCISLSRRSLGLEVVMRWVANNSSMDSSHMARLLRSKLMRAPSSNGHEFSIMHHGTIGGLPSASFSEERIVKHARHRTEYTLVAQGTKGLLVATMGPAQILSEHQSEVKDVIQSISFLAAK